jgi:hypothetical protein
MGGEGQRKDQNQLLDESFFTLMSESSGDNKGGFVMVAQPDGGSETSDLENGENFLRKVCLVSVLFQWIE